MSGGQKCPSCKRDDRNPNAFGVANGRSVCRSCVVEAGRKRRGGKRMDATEIAQAVCAVAEEEGLGRHLYGMENGKLSVLLRKGATVLEQVIPAGKSGPAQIEQARNIIRAAVEAKP
jgi:hypothetical protein